MLKSLSISNYALISELTIDFGSGMTVLTGETGAGKSIIIGALSLVQGQRAESRIIKEGEQKCVVEAIFEIKNYPIQHFFENNELDYTDFCVIRREITTNGKSRAFINDTPVSLNLLRYLTNQLLDIHSQHENLLLSTENYQMQVVDEVAKNQQILTAYQTAFLEWNRAKAELSKLKKDVEKQSADLDYFQFQLNQLEEANLISGEQIELETELEFLSHSEEIKRELIFVDNLMNGDEVGILRNLKESLNALRRIEKFLPEVVDWTERMDKSFIDLKDISEEISRKEEVMDFDPARLEFVENRLNTIYSLQKKFKVERVDDLIELRESFRSRMNRIDNFDEELKLAEKFVAETFENLKQTASLLTQSRQQVKASIEQHLIETLQQLGMPDVQFRIDINESDEFTEKGKDVVSFLFSANKNHSVQPVSEVASGGEFSRLMLAVKSLLVDQSDLPTIIFDEVDTGISGEIAGRMGEMMKMMSRNTQVIVITHLPQIAAKGNEHFKVYKDNSGSEAQTFIKKLNSDERIQEIAQLLSGKTVSEAAIQNAQELMQ